MKLWKYCAGYVNISIVGKYPEKLVNSLLLSGIRLKNVQRSGAGLRAGVLASDMRLLRIAARGSGCRVRILEKHGGAALLPKLRAARAFLILLPAFACAMAFALTRVWFIDIQTASIPREEIAEVLSGLGVERGCAKSGVQNSAIADSLRADPRVVNAKVVLKGVTLRIVISETEGYSAHPPDEAPSGIFADRDCVITELIVKSGVAKVSVGQAVRKGDLLISGDLSEMKEGFLVPAEGVIIGEVLHTAAATAPRRTERLVRSGRSSRAVSIKLFGQELFLGLPYESCEKELVSGSYLNACFLPIRVCGYECYELCLKAVDDTDEGTQLRARLAAQEKLRAGLPLDARIKTIRTDILQNGDGSVTARVTASALERINNGN